MCAPWGLSSPGLPASHWARPSNPELQDRELGGEQCDCKSNSFKQRTPVLEKSMQNCSPKCFSLEERYAKELFFLEVSALRSSYVGLQM